jgi:trans-2,3-dihydro-3-hydroxyanthranilate isomerase
MPAFEFLTVDVFTDRRFGGNPLAVFPEARGLTDSHMQAIAAEFNLSETTFVLPPRDPRHRARVRIFTPRAELPFAGHPNVGTAYVLARRDPVMPDDIVFEEESGLVRVRLLRGADQAVSGARIAAPGPLTIGEEVAAERVAACAGLEPADILTGVHKPLMASVGTWFVLAEVEPAALSRAAPDPAAFRAPAMPRNGLHLYARRDRVATRLRARMFWPLGGVLEDPATGSANATLAALLTALAPEIDVALAFEIEQGDGMGRPSRLLATARKTGEGSVTATVAGDCVPVMRGWIDL